MSALAVIKEAANAGVLVSLNGGALAIESPSRPSVDLLAKLRKHKSAIVALLQEPIQLPGEVMAQDGAADTWLQSQRPTGYSDDDWRQAIADAGRLGYGLAALAAKGAGQ